MQKQTRKRASVASTGRVKYPYRIVPLKLCVSTSLLSMFTPVGFITNFTCIMHDRNTFRLIIITIFIMVGMWSHTLTAQNYQDLIDRGWRRYSKINSRKAHKTFIRILLFRLVFPINNIVQLRLPLLEDH